MKKVCLPTYPLLSGDISGNKQLFLPFQNYVHVHTYYIYFNNRQMDCFYNYAKWYVLGCTFIVHVHGK